MTTRNGSNTTPHSRHPRATEPVDTPSAQERLRTYLASMDSLQACFADCTGPEAASTIVTGKEGSLQDDSPMLSPLARRGRRSAAPAAHP